MNKKTSAYLSKAILATLICGISIFILGCDIKLEVDAGDASGDASGDATGDASGDASGDGELTIGCDPTLETLDLDVWTVINNVDDLNSIGSDATGNYALADDISLTSPFQPIGDLGSTTDGTPSSFFEGQFDGRGCTISGLRIQAFSSNFVGLFSAIGSNGQVKNLTIALASGNSINPSVLGNAYVGGLSGYLAADATVDNVLISGGFIKALDPIVSNYAGGLAGYSSANIVSSHSTADVEGVRNTVGGLVGLTNGPITQSSASGIIKAYRKVGGLVGENLGLITDSSTSVDVMGDRYIGGLVGYNSHNIINSSASADVTGSSNVGGLVGLNSTYNMSIENSFASGTVNGGSAGGLVGVNIGKIIDSSATSNVSGSAIGGLVGSNQYQIINSHASGNVTGGSRAGGLVGSFSRKTVGRSPIINNCSASGNVTSTGDSAGGLVGQALVYTLINNSYATGDVTGGNDNSGGLVGQSFGEIKNSYSTSNVYGTRNNTGGIVGLYASDLTIKNTYSTGVIYGNFRVGGIIGRSEGGGTLTTSYATGQISGGGDVGALIGFVSWGVVSDFNYFSSSTTLSKLVGSYASGPSPAPAYNMLDPIPTVESEVSGLGSFGAADSTDDTEIWLWRQGKWPALIHVVNADQQE